MNLSPHGLAFLEHEEGFRTSPYLDQAQKWTIGCGHLLTEAELASSNLVIGEATIPWRQGITAQQVQDLLAQDCAGRETALSGLVVCPLTTNQFDALFSLMFNIGQGALSRSRLLEIINGGDWTGLDGAWLAYKFAGGQPILLPRRERELALWKS